MPCAAAGFEADGPLACIILEGADRLPSLVLEGSQACGKGGAIKTAQLPALYLALAACAS